MDSSETKILVKKAQRYDEDAFTEIDRKIKISDKEIYPGETKLWMKFIRRYGIILSTAFRKIKRRN